jgi:hypothetical protein
MAPGFPLPALGRQMPFHQLADVGERGQGYHCRDFQRPRQLARPVWTGQLEHSSRTHYFPQPADLPVQTPTKFELAINLKTVKGLDLTVPASLLASANGIIECEGSVSALGTKRTLPPL